MTIFEVEGKQQTSEAAPMTPEKARIEALKRVKQTAAQNLARERDRQKIAKAKATIKQINTKPTAA